MGLFNVIGSLQNIESAEAAGDTYETRPALAVNGIGTLAAAFFGSCFPTTIYIGHPGWKAMGARAGYSVLNGVFFALVGLTGTLAYIAWAVPIDAGMAIVLWIGLVITAQAFQATPREHAPAVVVGLLPGVAAWGALMAKNGLRAAGMGVPGGPPFSEALIPAFLASDTWIHGVFALEQGFIFTAMILSAATVGVLERRFRVAALWCLVGAVLSTVGLMHSYAWTPADTVVSLTPAWPWAIGYAVMALIFFLAPWITVEGEGH
jgi:AGZA family xanthine/uracil permease-like MFS transporter